MSDSIPQGNAGKPVQPALTGFPGYKPATKKRAPRGRQAPLVTCGQCGRRFRSWKPEAVCGRCEEDGSRKPAPARASAQLSELPGDTFEDIFRGAA